MICLIVKRLLPLYAGGDWGKGLMGWTERHLSQCPGCLAEYEALSAARDQVRKLAAQNAPRPSADLVGRTIAQLATDETEIRGRFAWPVQDRGGGGDSDSSRGSGTVAGKWGKGDRHR